MIGRVTAHDHNDASLPPRSTHRNVKIIGIPFLPSDGYRKREDLVHRVSHELWASKINRRSPRMLSVHELPGTGKLQ